MKEDNIKEKNICVCIPTINALVNEPLTHDITDCVCQYIIDDMNREDDTNMIT